VNAALVAGCGVAGGAVALLLPVDVTPSEDGRTVAAGPTPMPSTVLRTRWGQAMVLVTAGLWAALAARVGGSWVLPAELAVTAALVALTVVDARHQLLPRRIVGPAFLLALALLGLAAAATGAGDALVRALLCAAGAYLAFFVLRLVNPRALGGGDVTLAALLGLLLGYRSVLAVLSGLALGAILAAVFAVGALATRRARPDTALSYGPFLAAGAMVLLLAGPGGLGG
jgi:leader peptidase (prepilin peptidase) / N-methyltransferase